MYKKHILLVIIYANYKVDMVIHSIDSMHTIDISYYAPKGMYRIYT